MLTQFPEDKALLRQAEIKKLAEPRNHDLKVLREWLKREKGGNNFLTGFEELPWHEGETRDLVALSQSQRPPLANWAAERPIPWTLDRGLHTKVYRHLNLRKLTLMD